MQVLSTPSHCSGNGNTAWFSDAGRTQGPHTGTGSRYFNPLGNTVPVRIRHTRQHAEVHATALTAGQLPAFFQQPAGQKSTSEHDHTIIRAAATSNQHCHTNTHMQLNQAFTHTASAHECRGSSSLTCVVVTTHHPVTVGQTQCQTTFLPQPHTPVCGCPLVPSVRSPANITLAHAPPHSTPHRGRAQTASTRQHSRRCHSAAHP